MDPDSNPGDLERAEDLPAASPGGAQPVEEPVRPVSPTSSNGTLREVPGDGNLPGEEEDMDHMNMFVFPEPPNGEDLEFEVNALSWEEVMQTLQPEHQTLFENHYVVTRELIFGMTNDRNRTDFSDEDLEAYDATANDLMRILPSVPRDIAAIFTAFFQDTSAEVARLQPLVRLRRDVVSLLDYLIENNPRSLPPETLPTESSDDTCAICFECYVEGDVVVVLPCHRTHHFHRHCIQGWLLELVPEALTCPTCRTELVL
ncbi:hypothetical protein PCANC_07205 [Puccinia coronata f. sp. avenae]|uniref:RING-type domain-containing protein n=1 Tax=Puccinia coronata f. sp. avenae TaxID=200324 RepID=A0A2N5TEX7_9BASI|nr:hypothetical protein PCASD_14490 [Puccinia coronata f. sp. avenae]PLW53526.1 hypothetical protein PCANC_07205 [Puccinia coronata f. sp. avenae]